MPDTPSRAAPGGEPVRAPATWPAISDYWPDLPHRIGPAADFHSGDAPVPPPSRSPSRPPSRAPEETAPKPRRRRRRGLPAVLALVLAAGAGAVVAAQWRRDAAPEPVARPDRQLRPAPSSPAAPSGGPFVLSGPVAGVSEAAFDLTGDATTVTVRTGDLDGALYRVTAPADSALLPSATFGAGTVRVDLRASGRRGDAAVTVTLDEKVRWSLRIGSGLRRGDIDAASGRLSRVVLAGDAADMRLRLPEPERTMPVRVSGGINRLRITVPREAPLRIRARRGAGAATLDGRFIDGVARNTSFESPHWRGSRSGIDLDARQGLGALTVRREGA